MRKPSQLLYKRQPTALGLARQFELAASFSRIAAVAKLAVGKHDRGLCCK